MSQDSGEPKSSNLGPSSVCSRTPIRFGPAVEALFRQELPAYKMLFSEVTSEFLLYGYQRQSGENQYASILVQGSRFAGRLVGEVALSRRPEYPFYKWSDTPKLGVGGFRERVTVMVNGTDYSYTYSSPGELQAVLRDLVLMQSAMAMRAFGQQAGPILSREQQTWEPLYKEWLKAEEESRPGVGARYPGLPNEAEAEQILQGLLMERKFDRLMGPLKFRYRDPRFFYCHVYLLGRGLEFLETPEGLQIEQEELAAVTETERGQRMITWADILGPPPKPANEPRKKEMPPPLGDAIAGITGRQPQEMCVVFSSDRKARFHEYAFLKSLAALETFFGEGLA